MHKPVVLISGGTDGLGRAIAERIIATHTVVIMSASGPKSVEVAAELQCDSQVGDVSDYAAMERAIAQIVERHGRLDVLVNNAGIWLEGPLDENDPESIRRVIEVNTLGTLFLTRAALPQLKKQGSGRIINIISGAGKNAKAGRSVYAASKFAITGFTQALQGELAPAGITVTGIYPGKLDTRLFEKAGNPKPMRNALDPAIAAQAVVQVITSAPTTLFADISLHHIDG